MSKNIEILIVEEDLTQAEHLKHILDTGIVIRGEMALFFALAGRVASPA